MSFSPIALTIPQYEDYPNWWLKAYEQGTTTPLAMATDATGGTTAAKFELDPTGFPITAGSVRLIPFINGDYDLWLFPTETEANNNDTTNAIQFADELNTNPFDSSGGVAIFDTVANMKLESIAAGRTIQTQGYYSAGDGGGAEYLTVTAQAFDGYGDHELANNNIAVLQYNGVISSVKCGAINDGVTDSGAEINGSDAYAASAGLPLEIIGEFYTTVSITFTTTEIIASCNIEKSLTDAHAVKFSTTVKNFSGNIFAFFTTKPTTETNAVGFLYSSVYHASFNGSLRCEKVYSGFKNQSGDGILGVCFDNNFGHWYVRDFVTKAIDWGYPGTGSSTGNSVQNCYINGKDWDSPTLHPVVSPVISLNYCEGLTFETLHVEYCELTAAGRFFEIIGEVNLSIGVLHFEGNDATVSGTSSIFFISSNDEVNVNIDNIHMNLIEQSTGTLYLAVSNQSPEGSININTFSGDPTSNTISNYKIFNSNANADFNVNITNPDNIDDYFTSYTGGSASATYAPSVWLRNEPISIAAIFNNHASATIDVKKAFHIDFTGTIVASVTTISATPFPGEKVRRITLNNNGAGASDFATGGNIYFGGKTAPVTWSSGNTTAYLEYIFDDDIAVLHRSA